MKFFFQFLAALVVGAGYQCLRRGRCWEKGKGVIRALFFKRTRHIFAEQRLAACRKCPVFYAKLQTCGSPLIKDARDLGCFCYMPIKVTTQCNCWLYDQTDGEQGWTKSYNDYEPKPEEETGS